MYVIKYDIYYIIQILNKKMMFIFYYLFMFSYLFHISVFRDINIVKKMMQNEEIKNDMKNCIYQLNKYKKLKNNDSNYIIHQNDINTCIDSINCYIDANIESDIEDEYITVGSIDID